MGVSTNYSAWFGGGTNASTAVLTPQQVAAVAPLVRVTAAYVVMYYAFCFFQSWSKLYLSASRRPSHFSSYVDSCSCASSLARLFDEVPPLGAHRGDGVPSSASRGRDCYATYAIDARAPHTPSMRRRLGARDLKCWGDNRKGQSPEHVDGPWEQVACGSKATCAIADGGSHAECFGAAAHVYDTREKTAFRGRTLEQVSMGHGHLCVLDVEGEVVCHGHPVGDPLKRTHARHVPDGFIAA